MKNNVKLYAIGAALVATLALSICCMRAENAVGGDNSGAVATSDTVASERGQQALFGNPIRSAAQPVSVIEVMSNGRASSTWFSGTATVERDRNLSFRVSGTVGKMVMRNGFGVYGESMLARLEPYEQDRKIRKLETELGKARYEAMKARAAYETARAAFDAKTGTAEALNASIAALAQADRAERQARIQLQTAHRDLEWHEIKFAEKGRVDNVSVKIGDKVAAGQTVAVFHPAYPIRVKIMVPAFLLGQVGPDTSARARFADVKGSYAARILTVGPSTGGPKPTFPATLIVNRSGVGLQTGAAAEASFKLDYRIRPTSCIVPADALGRDDQGNFVFVVKPAEGGFGTLEKRRVTAPPAAAYGQEIPTGLNDGELVVVSYVSRLKDGMKVKYAKP